MNLNDRFESIHRNLVDRGWFMEVDDEHPLPTFRDIFGASAALFLIATVIVLLSIWGMNNANESSNLGLLIASIVGIVVAVCLTCMVMYSLVWTILQRTKIGRTKASK
jgi:quinol-cytochrome oxidoreductase complex cytochrome b subunit